MTSMTGSTRWRTTRLADIAEPAATPRTVPMAKPMRIRSRLISRSSASGLLCDGYGRLR
jgi:hypothetical protein